MSRFDKHFEIGWKVSVIYAALVSPFLFYQHGWGIWRSFGEIIIIFLICIIASLFPDVDTKSYSQKAIYTILAIVNLCAIAMGKYATSAMIGLAAMIPMLTDHRGIFHSYWMAALVPSIILSLTLDELSPFFILCWAAAWVGYTTHLGKDKMAKA